MMIDSSNAGVYDATRYEGKFRMNRVNLCVIKNGIAGILIGIILLAGGCGCPQANQSNQRTLLQKPDNETTGEHLYNYLEENVPQDLLNHGLYALIALL